MSVVDFLHDDQRDGREAWVETDDCSSLLPTRGYRPEGGAGVGSGGEQPGAHCQIPEGASGGEEEGKER